MTPRYAARVYTMTTTIYSKKSACRLGFRLINFLITNSSEWERVSGWRGRRHFIDQLQNFWCDWWQAGGGGRTGGDVQGRGSPVRSWLLLILQILLVIVYIYSVLLATQRPYLPFPAIESRGERDGVVRDTGRGTVFTSPESNDDMWY